MRRRIGLFAFICVGVVTGGLVQLKLPENSPVGSIVSELRGSIDSSTPINAELEFRIVKSDRQNGLEIFEIEGNQGKLIVKQSPDREILCPGEQKCLLEVQVILHFRSSGMVRNPPSYSYLYLDPWYDSGYERTVRSSRNGT